MHETTRSGDSTAHPKHIKLCPLPTEERDKDTLGITGPGTQKHWGKCFTKLYLEQEVTSGGPSTELGWVNSSLGEKLPGWLGHRSLIRWQGRATTVLQSHLWCHRRLIGWFDMNELAVPVSDDHMLLFLFPRHDCCPTGTICLFTLHRVSTYTDTVFMIPTYFPLVVS